MSSKFSLLIWAAAFSLGISSVSFAEEAEEKAAAADESKVDEALQGEILYVEALINNGLPDFAEPVIAATKKKWPESEAMFFALEIRGLLSLGKFDEAEKRIAALPDRSSSKYWAARLEVANNFFARGKKNECSAIYDAFFKKFEKPPKELRDFYMQASYSWGQILVGDRRFEEATKVYEGLLELLKRKATDEEANTWCNVACETSEMYLQLATGKEKVAERKPYLGSAKKLVDQLLWEQDRPVYFGRAIAMKANIELLKGDVAKAQATIDEYMGQLVELHQSIADFDKDGSLGLLKQSPMPLCRYMLADMLWKEAQAEFKKSKRDDERIKGLMFGEKTKAGKRNGAGAFNHSLNVFIKYPESTWAARAGDMNEEIRKFAEQNYAAKIKTQVTPEQMAKVREMQFRGANEKFANGDFKGAIVDYLSALSEYPEGKESVQAVENIATAYLNLLMRAKEDVSEEQKDDWRMDADAVEGYLSERFAGHHDRRVMSDAGDGVLRLAAMEKQRGDLSRADKLYKAFMINYRRHVNAAVTAASLAHEAQREEKYEDAVALWQIVEKYYASSVHYLTALANASVCYEKMGERDQAIAALVKYCEQEKAPLKRVQSQARLAQLYQKDGLEIFKSAETNETPELVEAQLKKGSAQIIRAIKQFTTFAKTSNEALADATVSAADKKKYAELKEISLYLVGDCWKAITKPADKLDMFRKRASASFEEYVKECPQGKYAKYAYLQLATIYTALGDLEGSKNALSRLSKDFPDSEEAKNAMPRLAKSLIEMGKTKEGTEIYANMLRTDGAYTAYQFVNAGEALILAKDWTLANQAFEKAVEKAGTNQMTTVARARIGQAKALYRQKAYDEARNQIDLFLSDEKMARLAIATDAYLLLVDVASEQGRTEKNDQLRVKNFNASVGAVKKLRNYWKAKPQHEQDAVDLMSVDVVMKRIRAEDAMDLKEQALESCRTAAAMLQTFLQTHEPSESLPFAKMKVGEQANLERAYAMVVPLFSRLGDEQADRVKQYGEAYLKYFPNGKARTEVINCLNKAKSAGGGAAAEAETASEEQAQTENEKQSQTENEEESKGENENE